MALHVQFDTTGGPEVLTLREVAVGAPGPGELLISVDAIGVNRADAMFRQGRYFYPPASPSGLGYEAAGTVAAVGPGVPDFAPGDSVSVVPAFKLTDYGTYGDQVLLPATAVLPRPADSDPVIAAAAWMGYLTGYGALAEDSQVAPGEAVLITAASGAVGLAAIQVVNRMGGVPIATTRTAGKRQRLLDAGAAHVVVTEEEDLVARVKAITDGRGVRTAMDPIGGPGLAEVAATVAPGGRLLVYGALDPRDDLTLPIPSFPGIDARLFVQFPIGGDPARLRRATAFVNGGLASGALAPVVDRTFDLTEAVEAHRYLESNAQFGKIVLTVRH